MFDIYLQFLKTEDSHSTGEGCGTYGDMPGDGGGEGAGEAHGGMPGDMPGDRFWRTETARVQLRPHFLSPPRAAARRRCQCRPPCTRGGAARACQVGAQAWTAADEPPGSGEENGLRRYYIIPTIPARPVRKGPPAPRGGIACLRDYSDVNPTTSCATGAVVAEVGAHIGYGHRQVVCVLGYGHRQVVCVRSKAGAVGDATKLPSKPAWTGCMHWVHALCTTSAGGPWGTRPPHEGPSRTCVGSYREPVRFLACPRSGGAPPGRRRTHGPSGRPQQASPRRRRSMAQGAAMGRKGSV